MIPLHRTPFAGVARDDAVGGHHEVRPLGDALQFLAARPVAAMKHLHGQARRELRRLLRPVPHDGHRRDQQGRVSLYDAVQRPHRGASRVECGVEFLAGAALLVGFGGETRLLLVEQEGEDLHRLSQPHVVGEDHAETGVGHPRQPVEAAALVFAQLADEAVGGGHPGPIELDDVADGAFGGVDGPALDGGAVQRSRPATGVDVDGHRGLRHRTFGEVDLAQGRRALSGGLAGLRLLLEELQGLARRFRICRDPRVAQSHETGAGVGQTANLVVRQHLVAERQPPLVVHDLVESDARLRGAAHRSRRLLLLRVDFQPQRRPGIDPRPREHDGDAGVAQIIDAAGHQLHDLLRAQQQVQPVAFRNGVAEHRERPLRHLQLRTQLREHRPTAHLGIQSLGGIDPDAVVHAQRPPQALAVVPAETTGSRSAARSVPASPVDDVDDPPMIGIVEILGLLEHQQQPDVLARRRRPPQRQIRGHLRRRPPQRLRIQQRPHERLPPLRRIRQVRQQSVDRPMEQPPHQVIEHPSPAIDHEHRRSALRDLRPPRGLLQSVGQPPLRPPLAVLPRHRDQRTPGARPPLQRLLQPDEEPQIRGERRVADVPAHRLQHRHRTLRHERPRRQHMPHRLALRRAQLHLGAPPGHRRQRTDGCGGQCGTCAVVKRPQHPVPVHPLQPQIQPRAGQPQAVEQMGGRRHAPIMPPGPDRAGACRGKRSNTRRSAGERGRRTPVAPPGNHHRHDPRHIVMESLFVPLTGGIKVPNRAVGRKNPGHRFARPAGNMTTSESHFYARRHDSPHQKEWNTWKRRPGISSPSSST